MSKTLGAKRSRPLDDVDAATASTNELLGRKVTIETMKRWTLKYARQHPECLFVFGDNLCKLGKAGQVISCAVIVVVVFIQIDA